jgi:hypothetical protein
MWDRVKTWENKAIPWSDDSTTEIPTKRRELMEEAERNKSPTNSQWIWWLKRDLECGVSVRERERERKSEGDDDSKKWTGKEWKKEGEEKKEEAATGQRTKTGSTDYKTGSTSFAAVWTVKARRKQCWLRGKPATLTAQTARLTDSADVEATKTGSTGFHQRKTGWVAYSADLLNLFWYVARKGFNYNQYLWHE